MKNITDYLQNDPLHYDFTDDCTESKEYQAKKVTKNILSIVLRNLMGKKYIR